MLAEFSIGHHGSSFVTFKKKKAQRSPVVVERGPFVRLVMFHCLTVSRHKSDSRQIGSLSMYDRMKLGKKKIGDRLLFGHEQSACFGNKKRPRRTSQRDNASVPSVSVMNR